MPIELWFPTPIYVKVFEDQTLDLCQKSLEQALDAYDFEGLKNPWGDTVKTSFVYGSDTNFLDLTPAIKDLFLQECKVFASELDIKEEIEIVDSWFNISYENNFQHFHIHNDFDISGIYYYQTNSEDGQLVFNKFRISANTRL
jgi:hypothetical protein